GESQEVLYNEYWRKFDDPFWRQEVTQGRLTRPRSDLFMQHFLASHLTEDIPIKHLFVEYKYWIEKKRPFSTVHEELATLARQRDHFRRILEPTKGDVIFPLVKFLEGFDIGTAYPVLLLLLESTPEAEWPKISAIFESYLLRRAVCGLTTQS